MTASVPGITKLIPNAYLGQYWCPKVIYSCWNISNPCVIQFEMIRQLKQMLSTNWRIFEFQTSLRETSCIKKAPEWYKHPNPLQNVKLQRSGVSRQSRYPSLVCLWVIVYHSDWFLSNGQCMVPVCTRPYCRWRLLWLFKAGGRRKYRHMASKLICRILFHRGKVFMCNVYLINETLIIAYVWKDLCARSMNREQR